MNTNISFTSFEKLHQQRNELLVELRTLQTAHRGLVSALEFYANKKNWFCSKFQKTFMTIASLDTEGDTWHGGKAAREALVQYGHKATPEAKDD